MVENMETIGWKLGSIEMMRAAVAYFLTTVHYLGKKGIKFVEM